MDTEYWQCLVGFGGCIPGDFPVHKEEFYPELILPGLNGAREKTEVKKEAGGAQSLG